MGPLDPRSEPPALTKETSMSVTRRLASGFAIALFAVSVFAADLPRAKPESVGLSSSRLQHINEVLHAKVDAGEIPGY